MKPIPLMLVLLVTAMALAARAPGNEAAGSPDAGSLASRGSAIQDPDIPEAVSEATRQGRYWRASRILGDHLAAVADTAPETILLASRLSAGWGNWSGVIRLLDGRPWLDEVDGGTGWALLGRSRIELGEPRAGSEALSRYLSVAETGDRDSALARIRRALALADDGRAEAAVAALDSAAEEVPWFADWIDILAAEVLAPTGDTAAVRERLAAVDPALENGRGWRLRMTAAREVGDTEAGRRIALEAARNASSDSERAAAWVELADLRLQAGDSARAREAYRSAIEASPGTTAGVDGARALSRMNPTPEEWRRIGLIYRRHGNQDRAIDGLSRFLDSGVGEPGERANVRLQLGRAYFGAGRYRQAESTLSELADDEVAPRIAAEALYWTARARYRQGRSGDGQA
ncbi:MAG TPA: tetratricopeptide repeat protein, partial [Longimicrobiales bacterium]|nr:tetratricopeptide repeat protein [Longimicrobiales bacterium]